jgi:hypothetical protein
MLSLGYVFEAKHSMSGASDAMTAIELRGPIAHREFRPAR